MGARPYDAERRAFVLMNGLPDALNIVLAPVMQAGSLAAVFVAGIMALLARRPRLAGLLVLAGGSAWVLAKVVKRVVNGGDPTTSSPPSSSGERNRWARGFRPAMRP